MAKAKTTKRRGGRKAGEWKLLTPEKLRQFREENGISRKRLADLLGVSTTTIQNWDMGKCPPSRDYQAKLLDLMSRPVLPKLAAFVPGQITGIGKSDAEAAEIEATGQIMAAWLQSNPKVKAEDVAKVVTSVRQALRR